MTTEQIKRGAVAAVAALAVVTLSACTAAAPEPSTTPSPSPSAVSQAVAAWTLNVGTETWGAPAVVGATVIVPGEDGVVRAVDGLAGALEWEFDTGTILRGAVATDESGIYVTGDGLAFKLSLDGSEVWRAKVGDPLPRAIEEDHYGPGPAVVDGVVYTGSQDGFVYALDAADGERIWRHDTGGAVQTTVVVADGLVQVSSMSGKHQALDAATGGVVWELDTGRPVTTQPLTIGDVVVVGSRSTHLTVRDAATGDKLWTESYGSSWVQSGAEAIDDDTFVIGSSDYKAVRSYNLDGTYGWLTKVVGWTWATPTHADGVVYVPELRVENHQPWDASLLALDAEDGSVLWTANTGDARSFQPGGFRTHGIAADAVIVGDYVVVAALDGVIYAFER